MSTLDLSPIIQPLITIAGTVLTGLLVIYVPKGIAAFERRTGIELTEAQRQTVLGAVQTAAGVIETRLDQGAMQVAHVKVSNANVAEQAQAVLNAVPQAAAALGLDVDRISRMIIGAVDTGSHGTTTATTTLTAPDEAVTETKQGPQT